MKNCCIFSTKPTGY